MTRVAALLTLVGVAIAGYLTYIHYAGIDPACTTGGCHANAESFDIIGGQTAMKESLRQLRQALNAQGWLTRATAAPYDVLTDAALMRAHRLELPFGFDPRAIDNLPG